MAGFGYTPPNSGGGGGGGEPYDLLVFRYITGLTLDALIGFVGWGNVVSGRYADSTGIHDVVQGSPGTVTPVSISTGQVMFADSVFDATQFQLKGAGWYEWNGSGWTTLIELDGDTITKVDAAGLDEGLLTVNAVLENHEGVLDTKHWCGAYFDTTVIDPTDYDTAPVSQPTPDGGVIANGVAVLVLTAADTTKRGIWQVDFDDGTWSQILYPNVLIGNSFTVMINAEGDADDGVRFEWIDDDPTIPKRRSYTFPGSSATFSDGRNGRWLKYAGPTSVI